jgi:hypothetical protein
MLYFRLCHYPQSFKSPEQQIPKAPNRTHSWLSWLTPSEAGISQQSYYRWRKEYGGLELDQAKRMKDLERENVRLKRLVADLSLKQVLKDVASGNL